MSAPTPYYEDKKAGIVIYNADCRDVLPTLPKVDLVLTDPPYGVSKGYASYEDSEVNLCEFIGVLFQIQSPKLITCGIGNIWRYPAADWVLCWYKPNCMTRAVVANANTWEPILVYGCKGFGVDSVNISISPQPFDHPCPKPERLFSWLIARATKLDALIIDPFCGSGTTLVAAKKLGRKCIGIEIEEKYCQIAVERLRQSVMTLSE